MRWHSRISADTRDRCFLRAHIPPVDRIPACEIRRWEGPTRFFLPTMAAAVQQDQKTFYGILPRKVADDPSHRKDNVQNGTRGRSLKIQRDGDAPLCVGRAA